MIYGNVVRQYERSTYGTNVVNIDESSFILESLYRERDNYNAILENCINNDKREILEAKYEVIQESITIAIIVAVIAAVGALIVLITKVMKSTNSVSNKVESQQKSVTKETLSELDKAEKSIDQIQTDYEERQRKLYQPEDDTEKYRKVADDLGLDIDSMSDTEYRNFAKNVDSGMYDQDNNDTDYFDNTDFDEEEMHKKYQEKFRKHNNNNYENKSWSDMRNDDQSQASVSSPEVTQKKKAMSKGDMIQKVKSGNSNYKKSREEIRNFKDSIKRHRIVDTKTESYKLFFDKFVELCESYFSKEFPGFYCGTLADNIQEECIRELNDETLMAANDYKEATSTAYNNMDTNKLPIQIKDMESNSSEIAENLKNGAAKIIFKSDFLRMFNNSDARFVKEKDAFGLLLFYYSSRSQYYAVLEGQMKIGYYCKHLIEDDAIGSYFNNQSAKKNADKVLTTLKNDLKKFERTLKTIKDKNYNVDRIDKYNSKASNNEKINKDKYLENMMYIDKNAISI